MQRLIWLTIVMLSICVRAQGQTTQPSLTASTNSTPTAEQKMNRLLAPPKDFGQPIAPSTQTGPVIDKTSGANAIAPGAPTLPVVREGTHLINVAGRLSHSADGQQAIFSFESDGATMKDPPMLVLPNLKLQGMEGALQSKAGDVHFRVSGTVTEYKGRNYILLDKAVVMADVEKTF